MSDLTLLKRRILSIKTTKKITRAMRLISMSLYSKLDKQRVALDDYKKKFKDTFDELSHQSPSWKNSLFFPQDILDSNPFFIVISATKGLCGGLNNNLFRYLERALFVEEHQTPSFLTIGKKATAFISDTKLGPIIASYNDLNSNNFPDIANHISKAIIEKTPHYSSATVYSAIFKNFFVQKPQKTSIIPLKHIPIEQEPETDLEETEYIWEQNNIEVLNYLAKKYLDTNLTHILFQALICEYAARFVAMDAATTNAENYLETLTLHFNKLRQSLITREISELSASL